MVVEVVGAAIYGHAVAITGQGAAQWSDLLCYRPFRNQAYYSDHLT
jgi:hypothetical protein